MIQNGTWAASAGKQMKEILSGMKNVEILENEITLKSSLREEQLGELQAMADQLAEDLV